MATAPAAVIAEVRASGHTEIASRTITVTRDGPDSPRVARAVQLLTEELNATPASSPGTTAH